MNRDATLAHRCMLVAACALAVLLPTITLAKGTPLAVSITGPGLPGPISVSDPLAMPALGILGIMQVETPIVPPADLGAGYELQRDDFDRVRYYPDPHGSWGYVFYVGIINGSSEYDGHWYRASTVGDATMRCIMEAHGVLLVGLRSNPSCATLLTAPNTEPASSAVTPTTAPLSVVQPAVNRTEGGAWTSWAIVLLSFGAGAGVAALFLTFFRRWPHRRTA